jgi:CubicO group peptidase (beta-lactamase class C family)
MRRLENEVALRCSRRPENSAGMAAPTEYIVRAQRQRRPQLATDQLRARLTALAQKYSVPGAQLAVHHNGVTVAVEAGELQYGTDRPVTREAAFPVGSISKTFTAALAMILVADGDLELDTPLGTYMPELSNDLGNQLTLRQLLSHTAGFTDGPDSDDLLAASIRRYVLSYCCSQNLVIPPGTGFSYSNIGYILAGYLIETITGMSWWDAIESILLWPMRIEPTFIRSADRRRPSRLLATGHSVNTAVGRTRPVMQSLALAEAPAGGLAVSALDLVSFGLTQLGRHTPALLPIRCGELMRQPVPGVEPFGLADRWGLGLAVFQCGNTTWVGHDGNADGTACYIRVEPVDGSVVAFTSNANVGFGMWQELVTELHAAGLPICNYTPFENLGRPAMPPSGCVGTYVNGDTEYSVSARDGEYFLSIDGEPVSRLTFYDDLAFSQEDIASGERIHPGRFFRGAITGELDSILVGGRLGRRQSARPDAAPSSRHLRCVGRHISTGVSKDATERSG